MATFQEWVAREQKRAGLSLRGLAEAAGLPFTTMRRIAAEGEAKGLPDPKAVRQIARAVGASVFDAFAAAGFFDGVTDREAAGLELAAEVTHMTEEEAALFLASAKAMIEEMKRQRSG